QLVFAIEFADGARTRTHHDGFGVGSAGGETYAREQLAVGNACGDEETIIAGNKIVGGQNAVQIVTRIKCPLTFIIVGWPEPTLQHTAHGFHRACGDNAFRCATDPHQHVDAGALTGRRNCSGDVAVGYEFDACSRLPDLVDEVAVTRPVQHAHRDITV